ncbi:hypothetical protein [Cohnella candidum]|uniref:hypothetical protein n=1 Tax=Cohnella candidum TaxID=2674991 RepID=UPI0013DDD2AE|nr:hypothetical protein [Cohnella candidum]
MAKSKNRASKADVQTTPANKLPVPELDTESAAEIVYGTENDMASRSAFNKQDSNNQS